MLTTEKVNDVLEELDFIEKMAIFEKYMANLSSRWKEEFE